MPHDDRVHVPIVTINILTLTVHKDIVTIKPLADPPSVVGFTPLADFHRATAVCMEFA
jgi:hypothetical protein